MKCLQVGDRVGIKRTSDGHMMVYINGENLGVAAANIPRVSADMFYFLFLDLENCTGFCQITYELDFLGISFSVSLAVRITVFPIALQNL